MMTSDQIAQQHGHAFRAGYGPSAGTGSYEPFTGFTPFGHGAGSQAGVGAMQGMSTFANASQMVGLGAMGGGFLLGKLGLGTSKAAMGLGRVATMTGMTLPASLSMGVITPAIAALQAAATGAQQYAGVQNTMDQAFGARVGMGGAFGYGVSRQDALSMTNAMRQMSQIPEMMTDFGELQNAMKKVTQMGLMQGVRDAQEFKTKFTAMTTALREMSKSLGSTLEEALPFLQSSVRQGFLDPGQMQLNVQRTSAATAVGIGMSRERMFQLQEQGGSMLRGMGADSRVGAEGIRNFAADLSVAQSMGVFKEQDVSRITGKIGEAGIADLATRFMGAQAQLFQNTGAGRLITAALAKRDEQGNFTGDFDKEMIDKLRLGQITGDELVGRGQQQLDSLTTEQALSFQNAMASGMGAEAAAMAGPGGAGSAITSILDRMGAKSRQARRRLIQQMTRLDQASADMMLKMAEESAQVTAQREEEMIQAAARDLSVAHFKEFKTVGGVMHHVGTGLRTRLVDPFREAGSRAAVGFGERFDELQARFLGSSIGGKANMLLNPFAVGGEMSELFFGDARLREMSGRDKRSAFASFLGGDGSPNTQITSTNVLGAALDRSRGAGYGLTYALGAGAGGALTGAGLSAYLGPGALIGAGVGGLAGLTYGTYKALQGDFGGVDILQEVFGTDIDSAFNATYTSDAQREAKARLAKYMGEQGISFTQLGNMGRDDLLEFAKNVGGASTLVAAGGRGKKAAEALRTNILGMARGASSEDVIAAQKEIEETFTGGFYDRFMSGTAGNQSFLGMGGGSFINSEGMLSMARGGAVGRNALRKILTDKELRTRLIQEAGNRDGIAKVMQEYGIDPSLLDDVMNAANAIQEGTAEMGGFGDRDFRNIADQVLNNLDVLDAGNKSEAEIAVSSVFREGFGGGDLAKKMLGLHGKGIRGVMQMQDALQGDTSKLGTRMRRAFKTNQIGDQSEADVLKRLTSMGFDADQLSSILDGTGSFTSAERKQANALLAYGGVMQPMVDAKLSRQGKLQDEMGVTGQMAQKAAEIQEKTIVELDKFARTNVDFVRAVSEVIPKAKASADLMATQSNGITQ